MTQHGEWIDNAPRLVEVPMPRDAAAFDALLDAARPVVLRSLAADWPAGITAKTVAPAG